MRNKEKTIVAALVAAEEIKDTTVETPNTKLRERPRRRRLGRRFGAINYMSGTSFVTPFTVRIP